MAATVSILVPAIKPDHLAKALLSALEQTFKDIEILVGDDTSDGRLRATVESLNSPLIQYFHHGFQDGIKNTQALWDKAEGKYIKWLFDDDFLMPASVETLLLALREYPDAAMAFHQRIIIDAEDKVVHTPEALLKPGTFARVDRQTLVRHMVPHLNNFVGEPSNILLNRDYVNQAEVRNYGAYRAMFLTDVAMYLNHAARGPIIAAGAYLSAFRRHALQASAVVSPIRSAGFFEWEIFVRGEAASGNLQAGELAIAKQKLERLYRAEAQRLPELAPFLETVGELTTLAPEALAESPGFARNIKNAQAAIAKRIEERKKTAGTGSLLVAAPPAQEKPSANHCVICEQAIPAWLPHPMLAEAKQRDFMRALETVGSTLEHHNCPRCGCNDRDRHLWLYLSRTNLLEDIPSMRILHIAPEARLEPRILALKPQEYIVGDLFPRQAHHRKINVESLEFMDGQFDLIICNHVLEHVDHPETALAEFNRCLSSDGYLIAQTPYSPILKQTLETTKPMSKEFQTRYYGQDDHVRLFGADIVRYFHDAGFKGDLYPHKHVLPHIGAVQFGINEREPFFLFAKGRAPALKDI